MWEKEIVQGVPPAVLWNLISSEMTNYNIDNASGGSSDVS